MRDIEFRAWDKDMKFMINDFHSKMIFQDVICRNTGDDKICKELDIYYDNYIVEQYIGLKDKHGVKIFEGDRLDADREKYSEEDEKSPYTVIYEDGCYRQDYGKSWDKSLSKPIITKNSLKVLNDEIVGNIHEGEK